MNSSLARTVLITGAAGNLGRAVAARFRAQGARLVLVDRTAAALQRAFPDPDGAVLVPLDVLEPGQVSEHIGQVIAQCGRIHVMCHLVGGFHMGEAVHETSLATWAALMDLNAGSLLRLSAMLVPHMVGHGGGHIVTVGAALAQQGAPGKGAYCAAKQALVRLTESLSAEGKAMGIHVNAVAPSILDTPENRSAMADADPAQWVRPEALADVIAFLASDGARAIHGACIPVNGLV